MRRRDYLEWAKKPRGVLSRSCVYLPAILDKIKQIYNSGEFEKLLDRDNHWGLTELKEEIARRYGIADTNEAPRILLTPGASNAIYLICDTFVTEGDEVIIETPVYEPVLSCAEHKKGRVVEWQRKAEDSFALDMKTLGALLSPRTRLILLTNLHNPTSAYTPAAEFRQIRDLVREAGCPAKIVVDEIYLDLKEDHDSKAHCVISLGDEFILISSLSKVYGLSRLRAGWIAGSRDAVQKLRETYKLVMNAGSLDSEAVAAIICRSMTDYAASARRAVGENRDILRNELGGLIGRGILEGQIPDWGCTYFPKLPWLDSEGYQAAERIVDALSEECGAVPGSFFGKDNWCYVRICYGGKQEALVPAVKRLKRSLEKYR